LRRRQRAHRRRRGVRGQAVAVAETHRPIRRRSGAADRHHRPVVVAGQRLCPGPRRTGRVTPRTVVAVNVRFATSLDGLETVKTGWPGRSHVSGPPPVTQVTVCAGLGGLWPFWLVDPFSIGGYSPLEC